MENRCCCGKREADLTRFLVTGGCGFIGSAFIKKAVELGHYVINVDCLSYAGSTLNVADVAGYERYRFEQVDIRNRSELVGVFGRHHPNAVIHFAAETHVDRSIDDPSAFVQTNIVGTFNLLEVSREHWVSLGRPGSFRFLHVSTDEVFGQLGLEGLFTEDTPYAPRSPYSASKASADHLVRAWHETYGLPCVVTNCSNNYGPFQNPENLIPHTILCALSGQKIAVFGNGENIRDWLHVDDHADALLLVADRAKPGRGYNIGGENEVSNIGVVSAICSILDGYGLQKTSFSEQIRFVGDRPGHDFRYAVESSRIKRELGWKPKMSFERGLRSTINWYLSNKLWCQEVLNTSDALARRGAAA